MLIIENILGSCLGKHVMTWKYLYWNVWMSVLLSGDFPSVPSPPKLTLTEADLHKHKITREPVILTRITVTYSDPGSPFLSKYRDIIKEYDIIAFTPTSEAALKQVIIILIWYTMIISNMKYFAHHEHNVDFYNYQ